MASLSFSNVKRGSGWIEGWSPSTSAWLLAGIGGLYVVLACLSAASRPLWYDELLTDSIARQTSFSSFWAAMENGPDLNPPLYHLAARGCRTLLGDGPLPLRLPAMVGYGVMVFCLYAIVSRRFGSVYGWIALLVPFATGAFHYAYEARPYGLMLGFCALSVLCWQELGTSSPWRIPVAWGLVIAIAGGISSHYYAVLVLLPLGLGEVARSLKRGRIDPMVWAAMGFGLLPLAAFRPLLAHAASTIADFPARPRWEQVPRFYRDLLGGEIPSLVVFLVLIALLPAARGSRTDSELEETEADRASSWRDGIPSPDLVVMAGLVAIPVFAMLLAMLLTGAFFDRYALPALIGIAWLGALVARRLSGGRDALAAVLAMALFASFCQRESGQVMASKAYAAGQADLLRRLDREATNLDLQVVVADPLLYLQLSHEAPRSLSKKMVHIPTEREDGPERTASRQLRCLSWWRYVRLAQYGPFLDEHASFLVYGRVEDGLLAELLDDSDRVEVRLLEPDLFLVRRTDRPIGPRAIADARTGDR